MRDAEIERSIVTVTKSNAILSIAPFVRFTSGRQKELITVSADEDTQKLVMSFREDIVDKLTAHELEALAHHQFYHSAMSHGKRLECKELCAVLAKEFDANRWLKPEDIDNMKSAAAKANEDGQDIHVLDPVEFAEAIGLHANAIHTIPLEVIHSFIHQEQPEGQEGEQQEGIPGDPGGDQPCDAGCSGQGDGEGGTFESAINSAIGALGQDEIEGRMAEMGQDRGDWGSALGRINQQTQEPPPWLKEVLDWCRKNIMQPDWKIVRTHTRPHMAKRQVGIHNPTYKRRPGWAVRDVVIGVDTSGSMVTELGPVEHIVQYLSMHGVKVHLVACDTRVTYDGPAAPWPFKNGMLGGGGTVLRPMADRIRQMDADGVLIFSDGYWEERPDPNRGKSSDMKQSKLLYIVPSHTQVNGHDKIDWVSRGY